VPSADAGKRNPLARQRAHVLGHASAPKWQIVEMLLGIGDEEFDLDGGLYLEEEDTTHPDQIPLLALRQVDDEGVVCGEVWLRPADLPGLIAALTEQLLLNYSAGTRRWRGMPDGPLLNLG
jgi:hypothetical protein